MTNEEMIKVLQQSMQELREDVQQSLEPINQRLDAIEGNMATMQSNIETIQDTMATKAEMGIIQDTMATKAEMANMATKADIGALDERMAGMDERMVRLQISYEQETQRIVNLLQEDYSRVSAAAAKTWDYDEVKSNVKEHERALINHNQRIKELEDKAI